MALKGHIPWNKGIKTGLISRSAFQAGIIPWNKGKKKLEMSGENHPMWGKHHTKETIKMISVSKKLQNKKGSLSATWKGGKPNCVTCGKKLSSYKYKHCTKHTEIDHKKIGLIGLIKQQNMKQPTSIEKKLYQALQDKGLLYETQKLINGRFLVDAYIPSLNLIIEADGNYWHSLERVKKKDKAENAYLKKCGYKLLRLPENEIKDGSFMNRIN